MAQDSKEGVDVLGQGIFETDGYAMKFFEGQDTNFDSIVVGDDRAVAWGQIDPIATATNNLEIKKNQDSGKCECCPVTAQNSETCHDCCIKVNYEQIKVGNRYANAFGFAAATNNVKIVTNQQ